MSFFTVLLIASFEYQFLISKKVKKFVSKLEKEHVNWIQELNSFVMEVLRKV